MLLAPTLSRRTEHGRALPMLLWRSTVPLLSVSSAPLGGGIGVREWALNATVPMSYDRDDPDAHLAQLAADLGLRGPGLGMLTGVDVVDMVSAVDDGVRVWATVGLGLPVWAAHVESAAVDGATMPPPVGTVNVVAQVPQRLGDAALVNAVATVTEAKAQAIVGLGLAATGTPTDAVCVLCPASGPAQPYGGPRSRWGAPLARAVYRAVTAGGQAFLAGHTATAQRRRRAP